MTTEQAPATPEELAQLDELNRLRADLSRLRSEALALRFRREAADAYAVDGVQPSWIAEPTLSRAEFEERAQAMWCRFYGCERPEAANTMLNTSGRIFYGYCIIHAYAWRIGEAPDDTFTVDGRSQLANQRYLARFREVNLTHDLEPLDAEVVYVVLAHNGARRTVTRRP